MATTDTNKTPKIEIIAAERGKEFEKNGEVVGFFDRSIVFFPRGEKCSPDQAYRLELKELTNPDGTIRMDRAGRPMYRSRPAPVEVSEVWETLIDGRLQQLLIRTDWRLQEVDRRVIDGPRQPTTRDVAKKDQRIQSRVLWGGAIQDTFVESTVTEITYEETERVNAKAELYWETTGDRKQVMPPEQVGVTMYQIREYGQWRVHAHEITVPADNGIGVILTLLDGGGKTFSHETTWGTLPSWLHAELQPLPICPCNRRRIKDDVGDGYARCSLCRVEEKCDRCGKQPVAVKVVNNCLICDNCRPLVEHEELIRRLVPAAKLSEMADLVQVLSESQVVEGNAGSVVVGALLQGVPEAEHIVRRGGEYPWYYFTADCKIFGSKFPTTAFEILRYLTTAQGNGLVTLCAWLVGSHKINDQGSDFFTRTQVRGETVQPVVGEYGLNNLAVADLIFDLGAHRRKKEEERRAEEAEQFHLQKLLEQGHDLAFARRVDAFVKEAIRLRGHNAPKILRREEEEAYGRGARTSAIDEQFPSINHQGLDWACGRDIRHVAFWAETVLGQVASIAMGDGTFTLKTDRHFHCKCDTIFIVDKGEWNSFRNGNQIKISCPVCRRSAWVDSSIERTVKSEESVPKVLPNASVSVNPEALAALRERFGGRRN